MSRGFLLPKNAKNVLKWDKNLIFSVLKTFSGKMW
jgi:hypothetical protein